nr:unnamed protein product [Callosobruchus analis]
MYLDQHNIYNNIVVFNNNYENNIYVTSWELEVCYVQQLGHEDLVTQSSDIANTFYPAKMMTNFCSCLKWSQTWTAATEKMNVTLVLNDNRQAQRTHKKFHWSNMTVNGTDKVAMRNISKVTQSKEINTTKKLKEIEEIGFTWEKSKSFQGTGFQIPEVEDSSNDRRDFKPSDYISDYIDDNFFQIIC